MVRYANELSQRFSVDVSFIMNEDESDCSIKISAVASHEFTSLKDENEWAELELAEHAEAYVGYIKKAMRFL